MSSEILELTRVWPVEAEMYVTGIILGVLHAKRAHIVRGVLLGSSLAHDSSIAFVAGRCAEASGGRPVSATG